MDFTLIIIIAIVVVAILALSFKVVKQGTVAVATYFGKYNRILTPGLNIIVPAFEQIFKRISIQNQALEMEFTAITQDQATVDFKTLLVYTVTSQEEENIKKAAFSFIDEKSFMQTLVRSIEGSIRTFVATKKQVEVLGLREEIVSAVKNHLDEQLSVWGYHIVDLQINDIVFDEAVMRSMSQVVASNNLKLAAENEGQATLITKTKAGEAERIFSILKSEGIAQMQENLGSKMMDIKSRMDKVDMQFSMLTVANWMDTLKYMAEHGEGNMIMIDGSTEGLEKTMRQLQGMQQFNKK